MLDLTRRLARLKAAARTHRDPGVFPLGTTSATSARTRASCARSMPDKLSQRFVPGKAGRLTLGLEANGDVKGCPSLPTADYVGGNVRDHSLREIWEQTAPQAGHARPAPWTTSWGFCRTCYGTPSRPRRLQLDDARSARQDREQPVLPSPRPRAAAARQTRANREDAGGRGDALRLRAFRDRRGTLAGGRDRPLP